MTFFNSKKIADVLSAQEIKPLESEFEIEELLVAVKSMEEKIKYFENLKKKRAQDVEMEITKIQNKIDVLKYIITLTLESTGNKSLNFPGTGRVSLSDRKGKWVIDNEDDLLAMLSKELDKKDYDKIVQTKAVYAKRGIDDQLDQWETGGKVPPCVHREPSTKPLKMTYNGETIVSYDEDEMEINVSKNTSKEKPQEESYNQTQEKNNVQKVDEDNFDGLEI